MAESTITPRPVNEAVAAPAPSADQNAAAPASAAPVTTPSQPAPEPHYIVARRESLQSQIKRAGDRRRKLSDEIGKIDPKSDRADELGLKLINIDGEIGRLNAELNGQGK